MKSSRRAPRDLVQEVVGDVSKGSLPRVGPFPFERGPLVPKRAPSAIGGGKVLCKEGGGHRLSLADPESRPKSDWG